MKSILMKNDDLSRKSSLKGKRITDTQHACEEAINFLLHALKTLSSIVYMN